MATDLCHRYRFVLYTGTYCPRIIEHFEQNSEPLSYLGLTLLMHRVGLFRLTF